MLLVLHVDEVQDDDAAQVAHPQLPRDRHGGLEIRAEDRFLEIAVADIATGIHVDGGHRLGLLDHEVAAGLQLHLLLQRAADLLLDAVQVEDRSRPAVQFDAIGELGHEGARELLHAQELVRRVHQHASHAGSELVAQYARGQRQIFVHEAAGRRRHRLLAHMRPQPVQIDHVGVQRLERRAQRGGAHDVAAPPAALQREPRDQLAQPRALRLVLDARRHADLGAARHVDEEARGQRDVRRQPRALGAQRILHDLHQEIVALAHQRADVRLGVEPRRQVLVAGGERRRENVRDVQEAGAGETDIQKRSLHAGQHARHAALVQVADQALAAESLDEHVLQGAVLDDGGARLARLDVHQDLDRHVPLPTLSAMPASPSSCAVS